MYSKHPIWELIFFLVESNFIIEDFVMSFVKITYDVRL